MKEYKHIESQEKGTVKVETIRYNNQHVLVRHFYGSHLNSAATIVIGYVHDTLPECKATVPVTPVRPITDPTDRQELSDKLRNAGEKKPIRFWD